MNELMNIQTLMPSSSEGHWKQNNTKTTYTNGKKWRNCFYQ